ncbi:MAG TPA: NAD(P)/FAD-dependent oxidoreductase [Actinomycetes bacterium]|nr:NAD(P)/FAD-dependent oxidoreductase [Actinomycetes bacterium]
MAFLTAPPHRVVVIGGGFGGLFATKALRRADVEVVLIDRTGHHLFQPLLYQVATGILSEGQITRSLREEFAKQTNARVLLGEVSEIDLAGRTVTSSAFGSSASTPYDSLIVAAGSAYSYFGHNEFTADAPGLKSVDDALEIRARIFAAFERAEAAQEEMERRRHLTFAVIGGGPTGIEMAGQIRDLARRSLKRNFGSIDPADARVVLLEAASSLLPTYGRRLSSRTVAALEEVGVEVHLDAGVTGVDAHAVDYEHSGRLHRLEATTKVWAAGVAAGSLATTLADQTGVERNRAGQLVLEPDCTLPGHSEVFVVGDLMSTPGVPGVAQLAIQSGRHAARTIRARLDGRTDSRPFVYRDKGSLATIARFQAVATVRGLGFSGLPAWLFWLGVHLWTVMGFGRRLSVTLRWAFAFVANRRPERVSTQLQAQWPSITPDRDLPRSNGSRAESPVASADLRTLAP